MTPVKKAFSNLVYSSILNLTYVRLSCKPKVSNLDTGFTFVKEDIARV